MLSSLEFIIEHLQNEDHNSVAMLIPQPRNIKAENTNYFSQIDIYLKSFTLPK